MPLELVEGRFHRLLDDEAARERASEVCRILLCMGKMAVDLLTHEKREAARHVAICWLEQLYLFNLADLRAMLDGYGNAEEIVWVQEELENMGYWDFMRSNLEAAAGGRSVRLIARPRSASLAEGSSLRYAHHQQILIESALGLAARKVSACFKAGSQQSEKVAG